MTPFDQIAHWPPKSNQSHNPAILLMEQLFRRDGLMKGVPMIALLTTKLFISRPRDNLALHPRLVDRAGIKQARYLAVITAQAAFGKTASLSDWISQRSCRIPSLSINDITGTPGAASCKLT
jgi:hypothetical protein